MYIILVTIEDDKCRDWDYVRYEKHDSPMMFYFIKEAKIYIIYNKLKGSEIHQL